MVGGRGKGWARERRVREGRARGLTNPARCTACCTEGEREREGGGVRPARCTARCITRERDI